MGKVVHCTFGDIAELCMSMLDVAQAQVGCGQHTSPGGALSTKEESAADLDMLMFLVHVNAE
jgi:hypothetical protein